MLTIIARTITVLVRIMMVLAVVMCQRIWLREPETRDTDSEKGTARSSSDEASANIINEETKADKVREVMAERFYTIMYDYRTENGFSKTNLQNIPFLVCIPLRL